MKKQILLSFVLFICLSSQAQFARFKIFPGVNVCMTEVTELTFTFDSALQSLPDKYLWSFGDGTYDTGFSCKHGNTTNGDFNVQLYVYTSKLLYADSLTKPIKILENPKPKLGPLKVCALTELLKSNLNVPQGLTCTYIWQINGSTYQSGQGISAISMPGLGKSKVTLLTNLSNGCSNGATDSILVLDQVKADFDVQNVCVQETSVFANNTSSAGKNVKYLWRFGDGTEDTVRNPTHQ